MVFVVPIGLPANVESPIGALVSVALAITVDDDQLVRFARETKDGLSHLILAAAEDLSHQLSSEGRNVSQRLGAHWPVELGVGSATVEAPEWWAHFVTGGTKDHGPQSAERLVFAVGGEMVFASFVRGVPANPFDEVAIARTRSRLDETLARVLP